MNKFVIVTDSCSDLEKELREKYAIEYVPNHILVEGKDLPASLDWEDIPAVDYYNLMRKGTRIITSQVNKETYKEAFEKYINEGYDILSISCSSGLSSSVKTSYVVRDEMLEKYPNAKIICIDALISCYGLGMLCIEASKLREQGKSLEETAEWVENHKLNVHQFGTVNDLKFLKLSGRVTATAALFGTLLNIKPIIISDAKGQNASIEKVKGRKNSLDNLIEKFKDNVEEVEYQQIYIGHADCMEDALYLKDKISEVYPNKNIDIHIGFIGPIVGASVGPSMIAIFFYGKKVTYVAGEK